LTNPAGTGFGAGGVGIGVGGVAGPGVYGSPIYPASPVGIVNPANAQYGGYPLYSAYPQNAVYSANAQANAAVHNYAKCVDNTGTGLGACSNNMLCVGDPRSRGLTMDSVCVPSQRACGGKMNAMCESGLICVPDPRDVGCKPWEGDFGCMGICV
jgi:hypothetical protein